MTGRAWQWLVGAVGSGARRVNERLHRHHGPEGVLGTDMADRHHGLLDDGDARCLPHLGEPMNIERLRELIENLLYPELVTYGRRDRARLLKEASKEPFDFLEWIGILAALIFVVSLTRYSVAGFSLVDRFAVMLANFLVAIPLLVLTVGPFLVRRTRRGLQKRRR